MLVRVSDVSKVMFTIIHWPVVQLKGQVVCQLPGVAQGLNEVLGGLQHCVIGHEVGGANLCLVV